MRMPSTRVEGTTMRRRRPLWTDGLWSDVVYALRSNIRKPGVAILAIVTLALGVAVNAASFAVTYSVLGRPLPYAEPSRIVILDSSFADGANVGFAPRVLPEWLQRLGTVQAASAYSRREVTVRTGTTTAVVPAALVTRPFFEVLGVRSEAGGTVVRPEDGQIVVSRRAVEQLWGDSDVNPTGMPVSVSERSYTVAGVMPSEFAFPDNEISVWLPSAEKALGYSRIVARLKPDVTLDQVREEANRIGREISPNAKEMSTVTPIGEAQVKGLQRLLAVTLAGAALVLLVACANVGTLFLGRDITRHGELVTRAALGASRLRLARALLVETFLIASLASLIGVVVSVGVVRLLVSQTASLVGGLSVEIGWPVIAGIVALTMLTTLLCGVTPAWQAMNLGASSLLHIGTHTPRLWKLRNTLVVAQIALCTILLVGAGLLVRTVSALLNDDHGFRPDSALEAAFVLWDAPFPNDTRGREAFIPALRERVAKLNGVQHAGFGTSLPPRPPLVRISVSVGSEQSGQTAMMNIAWATPGYLRALGARFLAGRDFEDTDASDNAPGVIVSESAARALFAGDDPVGRPIPNLPNIFRVAANSRVVGVVKDIKYDGLDSPAGSTIYLAWGRRPVGKGYLVVRTMADSAVYLAPEIRRIAAQIEPAIPVTEIQGLDDALAQSIANRRFRAVPAIVFGSLGLVVALVGLIATLTMLVAERRRDLAIRSALGARPGTLFGSVVRHGAILAVVGLACGLLLASATSRGLSSFLYEISPYDVLSFVGTACLVALSAILVSCAAAWRTLGIDARTTVLRE